MGTALYRKYRSRKLNEIVGQSHVTTLLSNAIKSGKTAHAYLFTGPKGVGKTSIARILAHEINSLPYTDEAIHLDIIEIDAASNNGVEDIRDLRERVQIAPVSSLKKIYIIDEVHMLSKQAFNALLKTLEEPPEHVVFILATTDIDKVPETIISRTQRHTFRRATEPDLIKNLHSIASKEGITVDEKALGLIARHADGSFRDSVSLFDQIVSGFNGNKLTVDHVINSLGLVTDDTVQALLSATITSDIATINSMLLELESKGVPPRTTAAQLADHLRRNITDHPGYPYLIDSLLDISRSRYPELKLLTTLSLFSQPVTKEQQPMTVTLTSTTMKAKPESNAATARNQKTSSDDQAKKLSQPVNNSSAVVSTKPKTIATQSEFEWKKLLAHVRTHHVALHSVLSKCNPEIDGNTLILYTKSAFYKKKLDDVKYRTLLLDSLTEVGYSFDIETVASAKPLKNSQAAQVAAIMGGGEEVSVDDA